MSCRTPIMQICDALKNLVGAPGLLAARPNGPVLILTDRQKVLDLRSGHPRRYAPKFSDLVSIDWQVMTGAQFKEACNPEASRKGRAA